MSGAHYLQAEQTKTRFSRIKKNNTGEKKIARIYGLGHGRVIVFLVSLSEYDTIV